MSTEVKNEQSVSKRFKKEENFDEQEAANKNESSSDSTKNETNSVVDESNDESSQDLGFNNSTSVHSLDSSTKKMLGGVGSGGSVGNPSTMQPNLMTNLNGMLNFLNTYFNKSALAMTSNQTNSDHQKRGSSSIPTSSSHEEDDGLMMDDDEEIDDVTDNESESARETAPAIQSQLDNDKHKSNNQQLFEMNNEKKSPIRGKSKFKRAECWNYFETRFCKKTNLYFDHCTVEKHGRACSAKFVHHGATTRLNKHLTQKHKIPLTIVNKTPSSSLAATSLSINPSTTTATASTTSNSMIPPSLSMMLGGRSDHWVTGKSIDGESGINTKTIECDESRCLSSSSSSSSAPASSAASTSSHSSLVLLNNDDLEHQHQAVKQHSNQQSITDSSLSSSSDLNMLLISFLLSSSNSFDLVENKWFRMFAHVLNSSYKMPTKEELVGLLSTKFVK